MPLEIREMLIRALVDPSKKGQSTLNQGASSVGGGETGSESSWELQKSLLDQFNKMLKKKKER